MPNHKPYNSRLGHNHDFVIKYRFFRQEEGGRKTGTPHQGYRSDFWYEHEDNKENEIFMIWPEFLNESNEIIRENNRPVQEKGKANMWIVNDEMREYHKNRIKIGMKGYLMEGAKKVAECEVVEIESLFENPIS